MIDQVRSAVTGNVGQVSESDTIDLRQILYFFWRWWKFILLTGAILTGVTFVGLRAVTPRYTATAQVLLDPGSQKYLGNLNTAPEVILEDAKIDSQLSLIRSTNLLRRAVETTNLTNDPEFNASTPSGLFTLLTQWLATVDEVAPKAAPSSSDTIPPDAAIRALRSSLDVTRVHRSYVVSISVTSVDPAKAALLANTVAEAYVIDQLNARYETAKTAANWFSQRVEGMREQVKQSEEEVTQFRKLLLGDYRLAFSELNSKLVAARAETAARRATYEQAAQLQRQDGNLETVSEVGRSPVISALRSQQAVTTQKIAELANRYNNDHPLVIRARAELRDINHGIAAEIGRIVSNLKNEYDVAKSREDSMQKSLDGISGAASGLDNSVRIRLRELERINAANKSLFENFLSQSKIISAQSTLDVRDSRIISPAEEPPVPSFPRKSLILSFVMVVGCFIGIVGGVAFEMLSPGFSTQREVEQKVGVPVLASIPLLSSKERTVDGKVLDPSDYCHRVPLSHYAEAVRALRTGVQITDVDDPPKVVLIISAVPKEGKSTLAISLAFSALKAGLQTIVIDGDLRHSSLSRHFGLEKSPGLVDFLAGTIGLEQTILSREGIMILPVGSKSQNPPDLLGSARVKALVEKLREDYDYVIIDTPPIGPVIDAKVAMALADKIIFVVRWQSTPREIVAQAIKRLGAGRKLAGIVLGMVDEAKVLRYDPDSLYSSRRYKSYYQGAGPDRKP